MTSEVLLKVALGGYAVSALLSLKIALGLGRPKIRPGRPIPPSPRWGLWLATLFLVVHTLAIAFRWKAAAHLPWSTPYEHLILVSWAIAGAGILGEYRSNAWGASLGSIIAGFFVGLFAWLVQDHSVLPVSPEQASAWYWVRGIIEAIALGALASSGSTSLARLLQGRTSIESLLAAFSALVATALIVARGETEKQAWVLAVAGIWGLNALFGYVTRSASEPARRWFARITQALFVVAWLATIALPVLSSVPRASRLAVVLAAALPLGAWVIGLVFRTDYVETAVSGSVELERWGYKSLLSGITCLALAMIAGAIWGCLSSGAYWSWSGREVSILSIALAYGIVLLGERSARTEGVLIATAAAAIFALGMGAG